MKTPLTGPIDLSPYLTSTVFTVAEGIALARALIANCPKKAPATVKRTVAKLARAADAAQTALSARQREDNQLSEEDNRLLDQEVDATWRGLRLILEGLAGLSHVRVPRARRAADLLTLLFGSSGLVFLNETYASQLTTMHALLQRIKEDKLDKEIEALCGRDCLSELQELMPRYERMVQAILNRRSGSAENLLTHRHVLSRAILAYATAICSTVDEDEPKTVVQAMTALQPLDGQRAAAAGRRGPSTNDAADAEDTPPAPAPPAAEPASPTA